MTYRQVSAWTLALLLPCGPALGQHSSHHGHGGFPGVSYVSGGVGMSWGGLRSSSWYGAGLGAYGSMVYFPPLFAVGPGGGFPMFGTMIVPPPLWPMAGALPGGGMGAFEVPAPAPVKPKRPDPSRAVHLVTIGDRLFRAGNTKRAAERFEQAVKADPNAAAPRIRLAQVALFRGQFVEAANHIRDAITAEPRWLATAPDIQAMYAEPADFARQLAKLETHLHAHPTDRDAWLVLGAQLYLSGRTRKAADVFLRLTDRKADPTLAAFLEVTSP